MSRRRRPWALRKRLNKLDNAKAARHSQAPLHWLDKHEQERDEIEEARRKQIEAEQERTRG